jgi:hypothetical protein
MGVNEFYLQGENAFLTGAIDASSDTLNLVLVGTGYTPNVAYNGDQYYSTVYPYIVGSPVTLTSVSCSGGTLSAANVSFTSVPGSTTITYLVLYKSTGTNSSSPLIAVWGSVTNLPYTTGSSSETLNIVWNSSVFTL